MTATCDYEGTNDQQDYSVVCKVNENTNEDCSQPAIVTPPIIRECGDEVME
jgi:hypothetical protein